MLKKECEEWGPATGQVKAFTRHLHLQALKDVPQFVREMAWINRSPAPAADVAAGAGESEYL